jgi:HSP20 family protein
MDDIDASFEKAIEDMFHSVKPLFSLSEQSWKPQMDIFETPEELIILAEIAGVEKENLEVEINRKAVRIFGHRRQMPRVENATFRLAEIQYGRFERILFLPVPIDPEVVSASYTNGLLQIRLAKLPAARTHKIPISD